MTDNAQPPTPAERPTRAVEGGTPATLPAWPARLGRFVVEREIGRGGMGVVVAALDESLGRRVALKLLAPRLGEGAADLARAEGEARALAAVNHPNVATLHGLERIDGRPVLVMELVEGPSLRDRLRGGPLPVREAVAVAAQVAAGLEAAHAGGLLHRDLKPSNVRLDARGAAKVLDFGIAARIVDLHEADPEAWTAGTPGYASPEQVEGRPSDVRSDAWGFGCLLFELLSGRPAFGAATREECHARTLAASPDWSALPESTPAGVRDILRACLARDPESRPATLGDVRRALARSLAWEPGAVAAGSGMEPDALPRPATSFVGRDREAREVAEALDAAFLTTLVGVGGTGKTRLALEVASRVGATFADGAHLVELAGVRDGAGVVPAIATCLGVRDAPGRELRDVVAEAAGVRSLLLVLDNCEHVAAACAEALVALEAASRGGLRALATSREPLGVQGERVVRVPTLGLPDEDASLDSIESSEAGALFMARARVAFPSLEPGRDDARRVARICRRLDGHPLALELAAARLAVLGLDELDERLRHALAPLDQDAGHGGRTLDATLEWSHEMLTEQERVLYRRLAVFAGSFTASAAQALAAEPPLRGAEIPGLLSRLAERSLVAPESHGSRRRYRLLELVREHAARHLALAGETETSVRAHVRVVAELAGLLWPVLAGPEPGPAFERLDEERDDLHAALAEARERPALATRGLELASRLGRYWQVRGQWSEGLALTESALAAPGAELETEAAAGCFYTSGILHWSRGDIAAGRERAERALSLRRRLGDAASLAQSLNGLAVMAISQGRLDEARRLFEEALALYEATGDARGVSNVVGNLGALCAEQLDARETERWCRRGLELARQSGNLTAAAIALGNIGWALAEQARPDEAAEAYRESLDACRRLGDREGIFRALNNLGSLLVDLGRHEEGEPLLLEALGLARAMGGRMGEAQALWNLAESDRELGRPAEGRRKLLAALDLLEPGSHPRLVASVLASLALLEVLSGRHENAAVLAGASQGVGGRHAADEELQRATSHVSRTLAACREALPPARLDEALARGGEMGTETAAALGLGRLADVER